MKEKFIDLIQENEGIIHKVINLYCDNSLDKKDFYQEILLQAWKSYPKFKSKSKFSTWLYKVSLNTILSLRSKNRISFVGSTDIVATCDDTQNRIDSSDKLRAMLISLNDLDKSIISLYLDGYKTSEISEIIGFSQSNIKVKIHRIKNSLIEKFKYS